MENVGYATLTIIPSARGFASALGGEINGPMSRAGSDGGRASGSAFSGAFKGLVGPAMAVMAGGMFTGFIAEAARASDATDKFKATMGFAGLDTSAITAATAAAKDFADQTVYDLPTIQNTIAQLASNGIEDYTGLTKAAGNLNAVAGGNAETFKSVAMMMTQTAGAGKLTTENWNQLSDAIPGAAGPIMSALEEAGAYTGNFRDAMAEGEITADEFNAALMKLGNDPIAVEAAKSTATFEGAIGNLEATINSGLMTALDAIKPAVTGAINLLSNGLGGAFAGLGSVLGPAVTHVKAFAASFQESGGLDRLASFGQTLVTTFAPVGAVVGAVLSGLGSQFLTLATSFSPLSLAFQALGPVLPALAAALGNVAVAVGGSLVTAMAGVIPIVQQLVATLSGVLIAIMPALTAMLITFGNAIAAMVPVMMPLISTVLSLAATLISQLAPVITTLITALLPMFVSIFGSLVNAVAPLISIIAGVLIPIIQSLMPVVVTVFGVIANVVTSAMQIVQGIIQVVTGVISGNWSAVWSGMGNILSGAWSLIKSIVSGGIALIGSVIGAGLSLVQSLWSGAWNGLKGLVSSAWSGISGAVSSGIGGMMGLISGLPGRITGALGNLGGLLVNSGQSLIQGFINGINNMIGSVTSAASNLVSKVRDFFPFSPAKRGAFAGRGYTTYSGKALTQDFAKSIAGNSGAVARAASLVAARAQGALVPDVPSFRTPTYEGGGLSGRHSAVTAGGTPLIGELTLQSSGNTKDDLNEAMFHVRRIARGGLHA